MDPLYKAIGWLLAVFYSFVPNLGVAIVLMTCVVMLVLFPLTAKQTRSMIAMQRVQPEIKRIQQQYKDDKQKQNEELLKFYQEHKINPLSGCLPMIIQAPVLIALYQTLRHIANHVPQTGAFDKLFQTLCPGAVGGEICDAPRGLYFAAMNLSVSPANSANAADGFVERLPYFIAVGLVILAGWYQQWQTLRRQQKSNPNNPLNRQMQMLTKVFPIMFGWFAFIASSGIVLYFLTSSLWRIGQQHLVLNKYYEAEAPPPKQKPPEPGDAPEGPDRPKPKAPSRHTSQKKRKRRR